MAAKVAMKLHRNTTQELEPCSNFTQPTQRLPITSPITSSRVVHWRLLQMQNQFMNLLINAVQ